ncbi:hypothetical protein CERZMDRAFT_37005 [Cercospora zeae-maydis SCOH1-5]|uniref:PAC domain-containing protein n=1 Tax=Cercospora zeae-maydis SCOH1-5 TaxID=717836 RepID=A0A6A6FMV5_9PEZI|nr:hypothetical protein CERZMDRAFT_37005 [Cercospora zeae-maydis SCOH1-5]
MSSAASQRSPSVFDIPEESLEQLYTDGAEAADTRDSTEERDSYNLGPPPPIRTHQLNNELETLSEHFFSADHLDLILKDYALTVRFKQFLKTYRPAYIDILKDFIEAKKAIAAIEYANAVAHRLQSPASYAPLRIARLDERFETQAKQKEKILVEEALPAYLTHRLVCLVTDTLVKEITGNSAPVMHELIPSLAEVYCLSDPSVQDNPIVYASEEFYNITQYTKEFTIGRNCRFLQGPKSPDTTVARLIQALKKGEECTETILNYKRDGTPFMNLLMIAPLYDNKGAVRYFLGCQIDVSSLIEGGRGVESFAQLLAQHKTEAMNGSFGIRKGGRRDPLLILSDWGQLLTEEEAEVVRNRAQKSSSRVPSEIISVSSSKVMVNRSGSRSSRILLGMEETPIERQLWPAANLGPSGRLPGVYQSYLLVRPYPSLRITFTSPSLRIPGLIQTKFLDRIGGPASVREGLLDALTRGTGVTAKVTWLTSHSHTDIDGGKTRWLHCTPLFGSDDRVGVWMVVICDDEAAVRTGSLSRAASTSTKGGGSGAQHFTSSKLYADYLKREGRDSRPMTAQTNGTRNSAVMPDELHQLSGDGDGLGGLQQHFRDF